jgi:hypothetical protein
MKKIIMMFAMAMAATSFATVSIDVDLMTLNDVNDQPISEGIKFLVFVDRNNDGIAGLDLSNYSDNNALWTAAATANQGTFLWDANDVIVYNGSNAGWGLDGYFSLQGANNGLVQLTLGIDGVDAGDHVYTMWFPELSGDATVPGNITQVGFLTDPNWTLPADTGVLSATGYDFNQSAIAVPEPASALLVALGGGLVYALRRKSNLFGK